MAASSDTANEIKKLQRCISDLISIVALPALWTATGGDPASIGRTLLDALSGMLGLDIAYMRLTSPAASSPAEIIRTNGVDAEQARRSVAAWLDTFRSDGSPSRIFIGTEISVVAVSLGLHGEFGVLVAGSRRSNFPEITEQLLLDVTANQAAIGLNEARVLTEQRRVASELDERVALRTRELAQINEALRQEIAERREVEKRLRDSEAEQRQTHLALQAALDEIRNSESKLRQVIDTIPAVVWWNLRDGPNEFLNKRWQEYTGLSPEESRGWGWQVAMHPDDLPSLMNKWREMLVSGEPGEIEARLRRHDGVYRSFIIRAEPFRDDAGEIVRWYGTSTDIEDRKRAEEALRAREKEFGLIINTIPAMVWSAGLDGASEFLSDNYLRYVGMSDDEARGWGWTAAVHPDDMPRMAEYWRAIRSSGEPGEFEARIRRYDGAFRWFLIRATPLRDETGKIARWYGLNTDIEDRKRAEERLRRSEAFLAEGQNLARVGNFSWLVATDEIRWSEQLYHIFEFETGELITFEKIGSRVHPEDIHLMYDMIEKAQRGVTVFAYEHRLIMKDGRIKYLHIVAHAARDGEGRREYIGAVQDVTERHLFDDALARARSQLATVSRVTTLGVLTASLAHEVNQPLSGIMTNASTCVRMLAAEPPNVEGARETALRTIRDGNRVSDVITRLRTLFSKKEAEIEAVDLNDATKEVLALSSNELQRLGVIVRRELAPDLPAVLGDRVQLQQVMINLIRNASDALSAIQDRARELLIRTERDGPERVRLTVSDTGVGFDAVAADQLFDAFYTTKEEGMGIGLSISRSIIEAHRGQLWAEPNHGPGSTFCFSIPCETDTKV